MLNEEHESIQNLTDFECNWLVQLYASTNRSHAKEVTQTAMRYIREACDTTPGTHGKFQTGSGKKHCVYAVVHRNIEYDVDYAYDL